MSERLNSLEPAAAPVRALRQRLSFKGELLLALFPTATVLLVFGLVEILSDQRLLFASLASSAFLIYLDPQHGTNSVRTLVVAQMTAALLGLFTYLTLGPGYLSGGSAMVLTIVLMILFDVVHPPAVSTALSFAFRSGDESNLIVFGLAVAITALLVVMEKLTLWAVTHVSRRLPHPAARRGTST